jgi:hypothetical protein
MILREPLLLLFLMIATLTLPGTAEKVPPWTELVPSVAKQAAEKPNSLKGTAFRPFVSD